MAAEVGPKHQFIGHFIQLKKGQSKRVGNFEYYFLFETSKGEKLGYPVRIPRSEISKIKQGNKQTQFLVEAQSASENVTVGEIKKSVPILKISSVKPLSLKSLGIVDKKRPYDPSESPLQIKDDRTIRYTKKGLNDKVVNAAIFTAGALLLGSMLFEK
jgi:hypothetical protein